MNSKAPQDEPWRGVAPDDNLQSWAPLLRVDDVVCHDPSLVISLVREPAPVDGLEDGLLVGGDLGREDLAGGVDRDGG